MMGRALLSASGKIGIGFLLLLVLTALAEAEEKKGRIVAVGGSVTEIIYALGEEHRLVGRDTTSTFPEAAEKLPDVGYIRALSPEGLLSVNPDIILMREGAGPFEVVELLQEADVQIVTVPHVATPEGITHKVRITSEALGVADKGEALAGKVAEEIEAARESVSDNADMSVLFILTMAGGNVMAAGQNTEADAIIQLAGARNAAQGFEGYKPLTPEAIALGNADVILLMDRSDARGVTDEMILSHGALSVTPAVRNKAIIRMDGLRLLGFSVRTASAISELSEALRSVGN